MILISAALLFAGCSLVSHFVPAPAAKPAQAGPLGAAVSAAVTAQANAARAQVDLLAAERARSAKTLANVNQIRDANSNAADSPAKTVVDIESEVAQNRLSDVQPDADEVAASAQRRALVESGKAQEARQAASAASAEARKLADELVSKGTALAQANAARDTAVKAQNDATTKFQADAERAQRDHEAEIKRLNDEHRAALDRLRSEEMLAQAKLLRLAALACLLIFGLGIGFGQFAGAKVVWPFGLFAPLLFGLAQIVSQPWFKWACLSVAVAILVIVGVWVLRHYKAGTMAADAQAKADQFKGALGPVVSVLDQAYESADAAGKKLLDDTVFNRLSDSMKAEAKSVVHQVRALL